MYFAEVAVFLLSCYITEGFNIHGFGLNYLLEKYNFTALSNSPDVVTQWIQQPMDHFNNAGNSTWRMKYFERLDMWKPNGPVFLFINGEAAAEEAKGFLSSGITFELAKETNGAMFLSEHRYYGESLPFQQFTSENLKFLSSMQALADKAALLKQIKLDPRFSSSKVVVVGGSYAGNLAAWMKLLYPDLVDAAISSSSPVLAKADFSEYLDTVGIDFKRYGTPGCFDKVNKRMHHFEELLKTDDGIKILKKEVGICDQVDMSKPKNQQLFLFSSLSEFMGDAQYGGLDSIQNTCQKFSIGDLRTFSSKNALLKHLWSDNLHCSNCDFYSMIESIKGSASMAWIYQTCTEFGYFQTLYFKIQEVPIIPVEYFYDMCTGIFGRDFDKKRVEEGVLKTNLMYGGLNPNVTNVVFVNGELDPWHRLSILQDISNDAPAKLIPFTVHCQVLFPETANDPKELKEARKYIKYLVKKWIGAN